MKIKHYINLYTLFGIGLGIVLILSIYLLTKQYIVSTNEVPVKIEFKPTINITETDTSRNIVISDSVKIFLSKSVLKLEKAHKNITEFQALYDEKINSINNRINDFYVSGGIIVTLLLLFGVVSSIRAKNETKIYLEDNFSSLQNEMEDELKQAKEIVGNIQTEYDLLKSKNSSEQV
jgi:hypothetical protein